MRNLTVSRRALVKQSNSLQNVVDELRATLNPIQVGKILIFLDKVLLLTYITLSNQKISIGKNAKGI